MTWLLPVYGAVAQLAPKMIDKIRTKTFFIIGLRGLQRELQSANGPVRNSSFWDLLTQETVCWLQSETHFAGIHDVVRVQRFLDALHDFQTVTVLFGHERRELYADTVSIFHRPTHLLH